MSDQSDYENELPRLSALPEAQIKTCPMPIGIYAQEAENLYHWSMEDAASLEQVGLSMEWINELPARIGALREAEARWQTQFRVRREAEQEWAQQSPAAYTLRDELLRAFRYALRKNAQGLQQVAIIASGEGHADMIQDLTSLAALGRQHTEALNSIRLDPAQLDLAATSADQMASLLAQVNGDRLSGNDARVLRDQAYTHLKEAVDEIRDCGKYVFHDNKNRIKGYSSAHYRKVNQSRDSEVPNPASPDSE